MIDSPQIPSELSTAEARRPGIGRRRVLLAALLALIIAAWLLLSNRGSELLWESERPGFGGAIRDGTVYSVITGDPVTFYARDLETGKQKLLARIPTPGRSVFMVTFTDAGAHFTTAPISPPASSPGGIRSTSRPRPLTDLGQYLYSETRPLGLGEERRITRFESNVGNGGELHFVSLPDGKHEIVRADTLNQPIYRIPKVLTRDVLYWVDNRRSFTATVFTPQARWFEYPYSGTLMASPLAGGRPRKVATGMQAVGGSDSAIWWERLRPFPDRATDLHYYIPATGEIGKVSGFGTNSYFEDRHIVGHRNRLYWLAPPEPDGSAVLFRANPTRTDPEIAVRLPVGSWVDPWLLRSNGRQLWVILNSAKLSAIHPARAGAYSHGAPEFALPEAAVIDVNAGNIALRSGPITTPKASGFHIEDSSLYYSSIEEVRSAFDFLSERDTLRLVGRLYRMPLNPVR